MRIPVLILGAGLALTACASTGEGPAVCDGKHLRPANPYGTVLLPPGDVGAASSPAGAAQAKPGARSNADSPQAFGSCP